MSFKRYLLFFLIILYFLINISAAPTVSKLIADYIGNHGWDDFNLYASFIAGFLCGALCFLLIFRLIIKLPTIAELFIGVIGISASAYILNHLVLLSSEFIHIPQFMFLSLLIFMAFPKNISAAIAVNVFFCVIDEWIQAWLPNRVLDLNDILLNFIGAFFGYILWWCLSGIQIHNPKRLFQHTQSEQFPTEVNAPLNTTLSTQD